MLKFVKGLFSGQSLNQTHVVTILNNVVAGAVTLVPSWSGKEQTIAACLSGVAANVYPLVAAIHRAVDAVVSLPAVSASAVASQAESVVKAEVQKVDFNKLVADAANAHGLSAASVEQIAVAKVRELVSQLLAAPAAPAAAPVAEAPAPGVVLPPPAA